MIRTILWKELLDLSRDRKTLAAVILLPLLGLPGLALLAGTLASTQTITITIIPEDENSTWFLENLTRGLENSIRRLGYKTNITVTSENKSIGPADLVILIPKGFTDNLTRLDGTGKLYISIGLGTGGEVAVQGLQYTLQYLSWNITLKRVQQLSQQANTTLNPASFLNPLQVIREYHEATGAPASPGKAEAAFTARLLEFAFLFVVNPAVIYMADSIVGERERKTMEKLLITPISKKTLLLGKITAAFILGFTTSLVDALGILLFFLFSGLPVTITRGLALVWALSAALIILVTAAIVATISARSTTARSAQNASFIVLAAAMAVYFAALLVDLSRVPTSVSIALQLIPFTHAALAVHTYAIGEPLGPVKHLAILAVFLAISIYIAVKSFKEERLVMYR